MDHSNWKNLVINDELDWKENNFIILSKEDIKTDNSKCLGIATNVEDFKKLLTLNYEEILIDGYFVKNWDL